MVQWWIKNLHKEMEKEIEKRGNAQGKNWTNNWIRIDDFTISISLIQFPI